MTLKIINYYILEYLKYMELTWTEFIAKLGTDVELITSSSGMDGVTLSEDRKTANILNVKITSSNPCVDNKINYNPISFPKSLKSADLSYLDVSNMSSICGAFQNCKNLISVSGLSFSNKLENTDIMFSECENLEFVDIDFSKSNVVSARYMYNFCSHLKKISIPKFNPKFGVDVTNMFLDASYKGVIDLSGINRVDDTTIFCSTKDNLLFVINKKIKSKIDKNFHDKLIYIEDSYVTQEYLYNTLKAYDAKRVPLIMKSTSFDDSKLIEEINNLKKELETLKAKVEENNKSITTESTRATTAETANTNSISSLSDTVLLNNEILSVKKSEDMDLDFVTDTVSTDSTATKSS